MTFEMWCEEKENISCQNMSLAEKSSLEYKFLDYLRNNFNPEVVDSSCDDEACSSVPARSYARA